MDGTHASGTETTDDPVRTYSGGIAGVSRLDSSGGSGFAH